jgi:hypothetical protein
MMKQHARESCEDESMMKQHVIQVKSFQDNSMHEGAVLAKCWPVAAGAWRAHVDRGPSRMRFDMAKCVPSSLFAFALGRLALVRAVAFNRPYTTCDRMTHRTAVSEWSAELSGSRAPAAAPHSTRDGPRAF